MVAAHCSYRSCCSIELFYFTTTTPSHILQKYSLMHELNTQLQTKVHSCCICQFSHSRAGTVLRSLKPNPPPCPLQFCLLDRRPRQKAWEDPKEAKEGSGVRGDSINKKSLKLKPTVLEVRLPSLRHQILHTKQVDVGWGALILERRIELFNVVLSTTCCHASTEYQMSNEH